MAQDAQESPHHIIQSPMPSANTLQERKLSSGDLTSEEKSMQTHSDCVCGDKEGQTGGDPQPLTLISYPAGPSSTAWHPCLQRTMVSSIYAECPYKRRQRLPLQEVPSLAQETTGNLCWEAS